MQPAEVQEPSIAVSQIGPDGDHAGTFAVPLGPRRASATIGLRSTRASPPVGCAEGPPQRSELR
jgi:hypothetical protein